MMTIIYALTLTRLAPSIHTRTYDHDIVDDCETAFTANPLSLSVPNTAVHECGSFVHLNPSLVERTRVWQLLLWKELPT